MTQYSKRAYKLAKDNTNINSDGKAVILENDEWRDEKEWDAMFEQLQKDREISDQMEVVMRLHDFLSFFDESTMVKIIDKDEVLMECKVGEVTQRVLNCRFLKNVIQRMVFYLYIRKLVNQKICWMNTSKENCNSVRCQVIW